MASPATSGPGTTPKRPSGDLYSEPYSFTAPYSPLATPNRSSIRRHHAARASTASVRFSLYEAYEPGEDHTDHLTKAALRNPSGARKQLFDRFFDPMSAYPLMDSPTSPTRSAAARKGGSVRTGSVRSAPQSVRSVRYRPARAPPDSPATPVSTTHVPSQWATPGRPVWAQRREPRPKGAPPASGDDDMHAATRPVTHGGSLSGHVCALDGLLQRPWRARDVEQAQSWGLFRRLTPLLGVPQLQSRTALLIARCAALQPPPSTAHTSSLSLSPSAASPAAARAHAAPHQPLLAPLAGELAAALPLLLSSPQAGTRQAGLCLTGLLWRSCGSHARGELLRAPRLLDALRGCVAQREYDALWALRELLDDTCAVVALGGEGPVLRAVCGELLALVRAAAAGAAAEGAGEDGAGEGGERAEEANKGGGSRAGQKKGAGKGAGVGAGKGAKGQGPAALGVSPGSSAGLVEACSSPQRVVGKRDRGSREEVEEEPELEAAARGVLVADCLAAFAGVQASAAHMVRTHRVPQRLVRLLLLTRVEGEQAGGAEGGAEQPGHGGGAQAAGQGAVPGPEGSMVDLVGAGAGAEAGAGAASGAASGGGAQGDGAGGEGGVDEEVLEEESMVLGSEDGEGGAEGPAGRRAAQPGAAVGSAAGAASEDAAQAQAAGAAAGEVLPGGAGVDAEAPAPSPARQHTLQLQDALLHALYALASCGQGREPQEAVQRALRDAGPSLVERLAEVLRERRRLSACSAAAYLLWLTASGPFSDNPASEANQLRYRMAQPLPDAEQGGRGGDSGGGGGSGSGGWGVVDAVSELLTSRLAAWRDEQLGDCVGRVHTTAKLPPPEPAPVPRHGLLGQGQHGGVVMIGGGDGWEGQGGPTSASAGSGATISGRPSSSNAHLGALGGWEGAGAGAGRPVSSRSGGPGGYSDGGRTAGTHGGSAATRGSVQGAGAAEHGGEHEGLGQGQGGPDPQQHLQHLQHLRVGSSGLLLTPRQSRPVPSAVAPSPQRYAPTAGSSDEDEYGGGAANGGRRTSRTGGGEGGGGSRGGAGSAAGAASDPFADPNEMDLSNVMDESVELTGKEHLMRAIKAAAAIVQAELDAEGNADDGCGAPNNSEDPAPTAAGAAAAAAATRSGEPGRGSGEHGGAHSSGMAAGGAPGLGFTASPNISAVHEIDLGASAASYGGAYGQRRMSQPWEGANSSLQYLPPQRHTSAGSGSGPGASNLGRSHPRLDHLRPSQLLVVPHSPQASPQHPRKPPAGPSPAFLARLAALRAARARPHRARPVPPPAELQAFMTHAAGLLAAVALSSSGSRAICGAPGLLPHVAGLLDVPWVGGAGGSKTAGGGAVDLAEVPEPSVAALNGCGLELRLQLIALLENLSLTSDGASAVAAATASSGTAPLPETLYRTARLSQLLLSRSATSWAAGLQLMEASFTVLANLHRARASLDLTADPETNKPRDCYQLAVDALAMPLPGPMGQSDRARARAAAARMLDSAIAAYEGVGRSAPPAAIAELVALLAAFAAGGGVKREPVGFGSGPAGGHGEGGGEGPREEAQAATACAAAGALWQLMAAGQLHPESVNAALQGPLTDILTGARSSPALTEAVLGVVSCLARSPLLARRMWTGPLLPAVLKAHARARKAGDDGVVGVARQVCQQLCRACHREDRGSVSNTDRTVDRWGLTERMLTQLNCRLQYDDGEEAIVLVGREDDE